MSDVTISEHGVTAACKRWLLGSHFQTDKDSKTEPDHDHPHHAHPWWKVMCLTGVDYFSTLGYQPSIAFLAAGALSPIATMVLVLLTLFGALPIYKRVAAASPNGEGSISMLEDLLPRWKGKMLVLALLGFVATDFVITITLSAADATQHLIENPFVHDFLEGKRVPVTLALVLALGLIFLKGFKEAIGIAVFLVAVYLVLNIIVICVGIFEITQRPEVISNWMDNLFTAPGVHGNPWLIIGVSLILFPKLALGLSGFETGVAVMPLVKGEKDDTTKNPIGRVHNTRKLLVAIALIMSILLIASSFITTMLIPHYEFNPGGEADGRALAYIAHKYLGHYFGTAYDLSTIFILWFAGASAMAGLLNIVPRYLPGYGMAPEWARAMRPLVFVYTFICFVITIAFDADTNAQGGAYATGVLVLMSSAAFAVTLSVWKQGMIRWMFLLIFLVFGYTTISNIYQRPEGIKIASFFIGSIIITSFVSRALRSTELRIDGIELGEHAKQFIKEAAQSGAIRIIAHRPDRSDVDEYSLKEKQERWNNHIPEKDPVLFLEIRPGDSSDFSGTLKVRGIKIGDHRVLRTKSPSVPNAIAAFLLHLRDEHDQIPHIYFGWTEGNPMFYVLKFIFFGEGDTAPVTHEILRQAESDPAKRPAVHVGG